MSLNIINYLNNFLIVTSVFFSGTLLSASIVSTFLWKPAYLKSKKELEIFIKNKPYHLKYNINNVNEETAEESSEENEETTEENSEEKEEEICFKNKYVYENTPNGGVIMRWNAIERGFEYWSNKNISYKILETVARKYVITFNCKDNYIEKYKILKKKYDKLKKEILKNIENEKNKEHNKEKKDNKTEYDIFVRPKKNLKTQFSRADLVCEKANKYIKKGKINELNFTIKTKKKEIKSISFMDWETIKLSMGC